MLNNYSCRSPLETFSVFWKSGETFNLEELINPMLAGYNFTENFTVHVAVVIFRNVSISAAVSPGEFIHQLLAWHIAVKKNEEQTLMHLVFWKYPRLWNYWWSSVLKTCTALIVGIFGRICCFDKVFLMALTSTEQLFIGRPLYRRFLHYDHLPYFQ